MVDFEEYEYTIEHKPGNVMQHADAISRAPVKRIRIFTLSWTEFEEAQNLDEDISVVKRWILNGSKTYVKPNETNKMLNALYNVFESLVVEKDVLC
jgi:hypothetical protein